ncbi:DNA polymerase III subunit epsilon [Acinetobacter larvae]|uniref:Ribonuclease H n=1 Tax=Acinetobacter larvae TaxID=1789224 RepID=A0A1B2M129_9GAMM|nr:DNA polymerase III subunit epsilon [Acinetobacter larvae]AOA58888.1 DNA polymerase III subunit epsilon [Acinetobacter larvae]
MSEKIVLYVDGACRGNPGLGGWGALILTPEQQHELCGGALQTTNNRMELQAAIEGIQYCAADAQLVIWTDSNYVKRGITEWISSWKNKNWKNVKNPELWQQLDQVCQGRDIEWNWVKGHAGHAGNETADRLANQGADLAAAAAQSASPNPILTAQNSTAMTAAIQQRYAFNPVQAVPTPASAAEATKTTDKKKIENDWLLDDPFGFDLLDNDAIAESTADTIAAETPATEIAAEKASTTLATATAHAVTATAEPTEQTDSDSDSDSDSAASFETESSSSHLAVPTAASQETTDIGQMTTDNSDIHPAIHITAANISLDGPRQLILDTETTGFYYQDGDRIIEIGAIEMINRKLTGSSIHIYIQPDKAVGDSVNVHGISDEFLVGKPRFAEIAQTAFAYLKGAEIIAHNASFDMNFLDAEFQRCKLPALSSVCEVVDTLAMAKHKHPGQKNSLDALVRRYDIIQRDRTFHGALLDAEILADVYLAMTGGQVAFDIDALSQTEHDHEHGQQQTSYSQYQLAYIAPSAEELAAHQQWMEKYQEKNDKACLFAQNSHNS